MYRITTSNYSEVIESLDYVKIEENGVMILCKESEAQGILTKDHSSILALKEKGLEDRYEVAEVQRINLDDYLKEYLNDYMNNSDIKKELEATQEAVDFLVLNAN